MWWSLLFIAAAPVSPESAAVSFDEALRRSELAADVSGAGEAVEVRRAGQYESLFTSNPQLTLQPALRTENGVARPEGQLALTQTLSLGGLGAARATVQRGDLAVAVLEHRLLRHERRLAVASAWVELWAAQEASALAHEEEGLARELVVRLERASAEGNSTRVELALARAFSAELAVLHLEWEGRRVEAGAALAELVGEVTLLEASGGLPSVGEPAVAALVTAQQLPVKLAQGQVTSERARLDESLAQWGPQLQLSVLGGHEAPSQWIVGAGVGLTLPVFEQGRRERTAHQAALARLNGGATLAERQAEVRLRLLSHELEHTAETLRTVVDEQLPAAEEAVTLETKRFAQGEATLLELTMLRRQALTTRIAAVFARARFVVARVRAKELEMAR